jgi:predicted negative regulator of RcsB-dependent stress response
MATIIIGLIVLAIVALAGYKVYKDHKKGPCASCGCGCDACSTSTCSTQNK